MKATRWISSLPLLRPWRRLFPPHRPKTNENTVLDTQHHTTVSQINDLLPRLYLQDVPFESAFQRFIAAMSGALGQYYSEEDLEELDIHLRTLLQRVLLPLEHMILRDEELVWIGVLTRKLIIISEYICKRSKKRYAWRLLTNRSKSSRITKSISYFYEAVQRYLDTFPEQTKLTQNKTGNEELGIDCFSRDRNSSVHCSGILDWAKRRFNGFQYGSHIVTWQIYERPLDMAWRWICSNSQERILLICGHGPTGESPLTDILKEYLTAHGCFGAQFFFTRGANALLAAAQIFYIIADQLSDFVPKFYHPIRAAIAANPRALFKLPEHQLKTFLLDPLRTQAKSAQPVVIIIGAISSCDHKEMVKEIIKLFSVTVHQLRHLNIRIIMTTRPLPHILQNIDTPAIRPLSSILVADPVANRKIQSGNHALAATLAMLQELPSDLPTPDVSKYSKQLIAAIENIQILNIQHVEELNCHLRRLFYLLESTNVTLKTRTGIPHLMHRLHKFTRNIESLSTRLSPIEVPPRLESLARRYPDGSRLIYTNRILRAILHSFELDLEPHIVRIETVFWNTVREVVEEAKLTTNTSIRSNIGRLVRVIQNDHGALREINNITELNRHLINLVETMRKTRQTSFLSEIYGDNICRFIWSLLRMVSLEYMSSNVKRILQTCVDYKALYALLGRGTLNPLKRIDLAQDTFHQLDMTNNTKFGPVLGRGGYSTVYLGTLSLDGNILKVAIKQIRLPGPRDLKKLRRHFFREVVLWHQFCHPNIVPLIGFALPDEDLPSLISPWYSNGNVVSYLCKEALADRFQLLGDVLSGLAYLHAHNFVHGDIKGENILVDDDGHAQLCDFGMTKFIEHTLDRTIERGGFALISKTDRPESEGECSHGISLRRASEGTTSSSQEGGTYRFMSPEILNGSKKSKSSDMWALGCSAIQIIHGHLPYPDLCGVASLTNAIITGVPPSSMDLTDVNLAEKEKEIWKSISACWCFNPALRPEASTLLEKIKRYCNVRSSVHKMGRFIG